MKNPKPRRKRMSAMIIHPDGKIEEDVDVAEVVKQSVEMYVKNQPTKIRVPVLFPCKCKPEEMKIALHRRMNYFMITACQNCQKERNSFGDFETRAPVFGPLLFIGYHTNKQNLPVYESLDKSEADSILERFNFVLDIFETTKFY